jgi:O-antigen ligase
MSERRRAAAGGSFLRYTILFLLGAGPLLAGAVHEPVFIPLLVGCAVCGAWAFWRGRPERERGALAPLPGARTLAALHGLVLLQLLPLPLPLLRIVSPGSHAFYRTTQLAASWQPISVSPGDTLRGLAFLAAFSLLYLAVFRELAEKHWRRRLLRTVVGVGLAITVVAFIQAVSPQPRVIYGLWHPRWDWAVFGPYVNRSHFGGYLLLATPLAIGFAMESFARLHAAWQGRRRRFLALGDPEGSTAIRRAAVVMALVAGLVAAGSRGAIGAFFATLLLLPLAARHRRRAALTMASLAALGTAWIGLGGFLAALQARGIRGSRIDLWLDMLPLVRRFPLFGTGLNAFSSAYPWYQTAAKVGPDWVGEAHNEYLQALLDTGLVGAALFAVLLGLVFRNALSRARHGPLDLGILGALLALALHNLVDFNWQIPANAATWIALAAVACRERSRDAAHEAA